MHNYYCIVVINITFKNREISNRNMTNGELGDRVREFHKRALEFLRDLEKNKGFVIVRREIGHDVAELKVGVGEHASLVFKTGKVSHAQEAARIYDTLLQYFKERGYEPYSYELVKPHFVAVGERTGIIQDYFEEPSLSELHSYLAMGDTIERRTRQFGMELTPEEISGIRGRFLYGTDCEVRCQQLLSAPHNRVITLEHIKEIQREFGIDINDLGLWVKSENVIILGQRGPNLQRTGLAIIDY